MTAIIDSLSNEPVDRLTRICAAMTDTFDNHPEHHEGDKCIVLLDDGTKGGIEIHNYNGATDALLDLILHVRALVETTLVDVRMVFVNDEGEVIL